MYSVDLTSRLTVNWPSRYLDCDWLGKWIPRVVVVTGKLQ